MMAPISLTPAFQRFGVPAQAPFQTQTQSSRGGGVNPLALALAAAGRGLVEGGSRGGLGTALLGATSAAVPAFMQGQLMNREREDEQAQLQAAQQQQALENLRAQGEAQRKAAADAEKVRQFGVTSGREERAEQRLGQSAAAQQAIAKGNLAVGQGNLALRGQEFERGRVDPLVEVFDNTSPTGSTLMPRSQAVGQAGVGSFAGSGLTPGKAEQLSAQAQGIQGAIGSLDRIIADIEQNPERAGAVGAINKFLQTGLGVGREVLDLVPGVSNVADALLGPAIAQESDEVRNFLSDQSIERNQTAANSIAYLLASKRKAGTGGRVTVKDIDLAFDDLQLTGLKSTKQKVAQLQELRRELTEGVGLLQQRVAGSPASVTQAIPSQPTGGGQVLRFDAQGNPVQ